MLSFFRREMMPDCGKNKRRNIKLVKRRFHTVTSNPDTLTKIWNGYVFDRIDRMGLWQYNVYIPELKLVSKITTGTKIDNLIYICLSMKIV